MDDRMVCTEMYRWRTLFLQFPDRLDLLSDRAAGDVRDGAGDSVFWLRTHMQLKMAGGEGYDE